MESITNEQLMQQMVAMIARQQEMLEKMQREPRIDFKLEGVKLPTYSGRVEESAQLFYEQMDQYFAAKGVPWKSKELAPRILATLGGSPLHNGLLFIEI